MANAADVMFIYSIVSVLFLLGFDSCVIAVSAQRLVFVLFAKNDQCIVCNQSVGVVCRTSASYADSMHLLDIFSNGHECRHRTEWLAEEVGVKTCDYDSDSSVGKSLYHIYKSVVKELCFVNADHFDIA